MAQIKKRLGNGNWLIHHDGRLYTRKIQRIIRRDATIEWWVRINNQRFMVKKNTQFVKKY